MSATAALLRTRRTACSRASDGSYFHAAAASCAYDDIHLTNGTLVPVLGA